MYISKLQINNYRSIDNLSIKLKQKTLIIGENNIGKTNLINALSILLNNEISGYRRRMLLLEDFNYDAIQKFKNEVADIKIAASDVEFPEIKVVATFTDFKNEDEETLVSEWYSDDKHTEAQLKYRYFCNLRNKVEWVEKERDQFKKETLEEMVELIDLPISEYKYKIVAGKGNIKPDNFQLAPFKVDFLDALRDAKKELTASRENRLLYRILHNRDHLKYKHIKDSAYTLNRSINNKKGELATIKEDISKLLDILSLETEKSTNEINFNFSDLSVSELLKKIGLEYGDKPISIQNNGLGRNNLLFMSLVLSHIQEKENEADFRVIAIEEPEAHISPILQKHYAENVSNDDFFSKGSNRQVILTSHSTHICSYLDLENTVVLFKDGDTLNSHYILDGIENNTKGKKTKDYLRKWLSATNSVMFFSRRIIFVEGIAEQLIVPKLFELHFGVKPEKKNCQIINVNGVAFRNFLEISKNGYFVKIAVLTDSDSQTITGQRATKLKKDYDSNKILINITDETTFEKDLIKFNRSGKGRTKLKNAVKSTRPKLFKKELEVLFKKKLDIEKIFNSIEGYKSEFSFELLNELERSNDFTIPRYITDAFNFISE